MLIVYPASISEADEPDYGTGALGDVTISTTVTLTAAANYRLLTITGTGVLVANGWPIHATVGIVVDAGGVIHANGAAGGANAGGQGGGIVAIFTPTLINNGTIRANGGAGGNRNATGGNGGGTVDNGGGGGGAGNLTGGIGRTNGGAGVLATGSAFYGGGGGGAGGDGETPLSGGTPATGGNSGERGVGESNYAWGIGINPLWSSANALHLAGGAGGNGGQVNTSGQANGGGGATWGLGGRSHRSAGSFPDYWATMVEVPVFRYPLALFGGGGGGGANGYQTAAGGGGGGGLILTVTKARSGSGIYQVNGGAAGTGEGSITYPAQAGRSGLIVHFSA
jgi:hypothetical protein